MKGYLLSGFAASVLFLTACSSSTDPTTKPPGFLPNYSLLKTVANSDDGTTLYRYINPEFKRSDYHAVKIEPVVIFMPVSESGDVTLAMVANAKKSLDTYLRSEVRQKFKVSNRAGAGVAVLKVAITGAELDGDGFQLRNLIPISAAIRLATMAAGYSNKHAVLIIEAKVLDSESGELLGEAFNVIKSERFRNQDVASAQFQALAQKWVKDAVKNAAGYKQ